MQKFIYKFKSTNNNEIRKRCKINKNANRKHFTRGRYLTTVCCYYAL